MLMHIFLCVVKCSYILFHADAHFPLCCKVFLYFRTMPSILLTTPRGKTTLSLILDGNGIESQQKNAWDLSPHLSRALG
jgi:hypothetical protein